MKSIILLTLCLLTFNSSFGQPERLDFIRAGVLYLAKVQTKGDLSRVEKALDTADLIEYSDDKEIKGLSARITIWSDVKLNELSAEIDSFLTCDTDFKIKRCEDYSEDCEELRKTLYELNESLGQSDEKSANGDAHSGGDGKEDLLIEEKSFFTFSNILSFLALLLSTAAISFFLQQKKRLDLVEKEKNDFNDKVKRDFEKVQSQLTQIQKNNTNSTSQNRVESPSSKAEKEKIPLTITPAVSVPVASSVKFAKSASNSVFKNIDLKNKQNGEYIFELHIKGRTGELKLSVDKKAQQYALSSNPDYYFNSDSCIIKGKPASGKDIYISSPGRIELSNDEMSWKITQKISLEFK